MHNGQVTELTGRAYILVPDITLTVGIYLPESAGGAIGEVTDSQWAGMRHHEIARVRGLYYQEDQALALWEVDDWNRLDDFALGRLWQGFECWLMLRYPKATRIFTDDSEPGESTEDNQESRCRHVPLPGWSPLLVLDATDRHEARGGSGGAAKTRSRQGPGRVEKRLREDLRQLGDFSRVHPMPHSGAEVPDDDDARLVVLSIDYPCSKEPGNAAEVAAKAIVENRGTTPRKHRNTLVFLAADTNRLPDLDEAVRHYLAWDSILAEQKTLDIAPQQVKQAENQLAAASGAIKARLPETYQWLLVPVQSSPQTPVEWQAFRLSGQDALAVRASKKLRSDELLLTGFAATRLRMELDRVPLWRNDHVVIKQLVQDFACYPYLPRLKNPSVLLGAIREGVGLLTWERESFAYADSYDEVAERYRGLRGGHNISLIDGASSAMLVRPDVARKQMDMEIPVDPDRDPLPKPPGGEDPIPPQGGGTIKPTQSATRPTRFHGTVTVDAARVGRDAARIAEEVIAHVAGLVGAKVTVTIEVDAEIPAGAPENVVRTVTENSRTLGFTSHGFEKE